MGSVLAVPTLRLFSPSMRVDALVSDWKASLPETSPEGKEQWLYDQALQEYLSGDFGFGLWCWFECDRLTNATGSIREVTRILGPGKYLGFSHRKEIASRV
ncbi:MAG TPA: hypothetical protein VJS68_02400, partial [Thermoplasmata archaeon]|nr:hypothetical protein [Thermoplasmata archaeon]